MTTQETAAAFAFEQFVEDTFVCSAVVVVVFLMFWIFYTLSFHSPYSSSPLEATPCPASPSHLSQPPPTFDDLHYVPFARWRCSLTCRHVQHQARCK